METEVMGEKPKPRLPHQVNHPPPPYTTSAGMIIPFPPTYDHFLHSCNPAAGHFNPLLYPHYGRWCQYSHPAFPHHPLHAFFLFPLNPNYYYFPSQVAYALDSGEGCWPFQKMVDDGASVEFGDTGGGSPVVSPLKPPRLFELKNNQSPGVGENIIALGKEGTQIYADTGVVKGRRSEMITGVEHEVRELSFTPPPPRLRKATRRRTEAGARFRIPRRESTVAQWRPKKSSHASADPTEDCDGGGGGGGDSAVESGVNDGVEDDSSPRTSVMIKNIPNKLRRRGLITFLDGYCMDHKLEFDFLYLPMDFKTQDNKGYAFLNLTNTAAALKIMNHLNNFEWGLLPIKGCMQSKKICAVTWAKIQGKMALVQHFQTSNFRCHTDEYLPAVFYPPRNGSTSLSHPRPIGSRDRPLFLWR